MQRNIMYHMDQSNFSTDGWLSTLLKTRRTASLKKQGRPSTVAAYEQEVNNYSDNDDLYNEDYEVEEAFELVENHPIHNEEDGIEYF